MDNTRCEAFNFNPAARISEFEGGPGLGTKLACSRAVHVDGDHAAGPWRWRFEGGVPFMVTGATVPG